MPAAALRRGALLGIALAVAAVYRGTLSCPFIYDDHVWVTHNPSIGRLWPPGGALLAPPGSAVGGRPVLSLSLALNHALSGDGAWSYHLANIAIHVLAAFTLFGAVSRTLALMPGRFPSEEDRIGPAFAVALLWAVHPLQTEAVTYVAQRSESLMGLFYLLVLYCFIRASRPPGGRGWGALSVLACLLGMATKEVMVTAPLAVLAYDRTFVAGSAREALRLRWRLYLGLASTWLVAAWLSAGLGARGVGYGLGFTWWAYGLTECWAVCHYILLSLFPHPLVFDYGTRLVGSVGEAVPWALALAAAVAAAGAAYWRRTALGFAGAWFFLVLAPASSVVPVAYQPMAEHRMYLPLAAVAAALVLGAWARLGRRSLPLVLAAALALGTASFLRNRDYSSETAIWADTVARRPSNPRARIALGDALSAESRHAEAAEQFSQALRMDPGDAETRRKLGLALFRLGGAAQALAQYRMIVPPTPDSAPLHYDIGLALEASGRIREAIAELEKAARLDPNDAQIRASLDRLRTPPPDS